MSRRTILDHTPDGLKRRIADLERQVSDLSRKGTPAPSYVEPRIPLIFHWSGAVTDLVDMRAGPDWFTSGGRIARVEYHFDTPAAVTVEWKLNGTTFATHSPSADSIVTLNQAYAGEDVVAVVTAANASAAGLTARVFQG